MIPPPHIAAARCGCLAAVRRAAALRVGCRRGKAPSPRLSKSPRRFTRPAAYPCWLACSGRRASVRLASGVGRGAASAPGAGSAGGAPPCRCRASCWPRGFGGVRARQIAGHSPAAPARPPRAACPSTAAGRLRFVRLPPVLRRPAVLPPAPRPPGLFSSLLAGALLLPRRPPSAPPAPVGYAAGGSRRARPRPAPVVVPRFWPRCPAAAGLRAARRPPCLGGLPRRAGAASAPRWALWPPFARCAAGGGWRSLGVRPPFQPVPCRQVPCLSSVGPPDPCAALLSDLSDRRRMGAPPWGAFGLDGDGFQLVQIRHNHWLQPL